MRKCAASVLLLLFALAHGAHAVPKWTEGTNYFLILPAQPASVDEGKVEVAEAFSYGCPACNQFQPVMKKLAASLPANAVITYVPASFIPTEQWPLFQRAYYTARALDVDEKTHSAMFDAIWTTGQLAIVDRQTGRLKNPPPDLEDVANFYAERTDVTAEQFLAAAKSFEVAMDMRSADQWIKACHVDRTPTIVVNGKYRLHVGSAGGVDELIELVNWLVAKENDSAGAMTLSSGSR